MLKFDRRQIGDFFIMYNFNRLQLPQQLQLSPKRQLLTETSIADSRRLGNRVIFLFSHSNDRATAIVSRTYSRALIESTLQVQVLIYFHFQKIYSKVLLINMSGLVCSNNGLSFFFLERSY